MPFSGRSTYAYECPLMALSGHSNRVVCCPLSGVKRTCRLHRKMSANDPKISAMLWGFSYGMLS